MANCKLKLWIAYREKSVRKYKFRAVKHKPVLHWHLTNKLDEIQICKNTVFSRMFVYGTVRNTVCNLEKFRKGVKTVFSCWVLSVEPTWHLEADAQLVAN